VSKPPSAPTVFAPTECELGEGPVWDERRSGLFWLDILRQTLYFKQVGDITHSEWTLPCIASAIFLPESGFDGVLLATENGLASFQLETGRFLVLATTGNEAPAMRTNDGGVDANGRIWFGTMAKDGGTLPGAVYSWSSLEGMRKVLPEVYIPNTFVWSEDGAAMITADSYRGFINRYKFDPANGTPEFERQLVGPASDGCEPDGSAMDVEDSFWNARWNGARIDRYRLDGSMAETVGVPALHASLTKPGFAAYATSKAALVGMTRALAVDIGDRVRVNAICPAAISTPMLVEGLESQPGALERLASFHPTGRIGTPEEVAELAFQISSPQLRFLSGSIIGLDGGIAGRLHDPA